MGHDIAFTAMLSIFGCNDRQTGMQIKRQAGRRKKEKQTNRRQPIKNKICCIANIQKFFGEAEVLY